MFATIATIVIKPDKWEEAWKMGEERAKEQIKVPGMKGYIVMSEPESHKVVKVVLWESEEAMKSHVESELAHEAMEKATELLAGPIELENLPVVAMRFADAPVVVM